MNPDMIHRWHCERCGETLEIEAETLTHKPVLPEGWSYFHQKHVEHLAVRRDVAVTKYLCTNCTHDVRHAAQSAPRWRVIREGDYEEFLNWEANAKAGLVVELPANYSIVGGEPPQVTFHASSDGLCCHLCGRATTHVHVDPGSLELLITTLRQWDG